MVKIIAVDVEGSVIFGHSPKKRHVSGIGSSKRPPILEEAIIDEVVYVSEAEIIAGCKNLLREQMIFGGASSGAVYYAIAKYFETRRVEEDANIVFLCPDRGGAYADTIYNDKWADKIEPQTNEQLVAFK